MIMLEGMHASRQVQLADHSISGASVKQQPIPV
jgi:hypothetical protein